MAILLRGYLMPLGEATCLIGLRLPALCHPIDTPLQTARRPTLNMSVGRPVGLMAHYWVVLGIVASKVGLPRPPISVGLPLANSASEPVKPHVYGFGSLLPHCIVDDAIGCVVARPCQQPMGWPLVQQSKAGAKQLA